MININNNLNINNGGNQRNFEKNKNENSKYNIPTYTNLVFICFCHLKKFVDYFKLNHDSNNNLKSKTSLTYLFKNIIEKIKTSESQSNPTIENIINKFTPDINKTITNLTHIFNASNNSPVQPMDFVNFIIMTLHKELNKQKTDTTFIANNYDNNLDQTNENIMWNNFMKRFLNENKSIISDIFYGTLHNEIKCSNNICGIVKHNFEIFQFLIFDLENTKQFKINNLNSFIRLNPQLNNQQMQLNLECLNTINSVSIYDCFDFTKRVQTLTGNDSIPCDRCNNTFSSYYQSVIYTPPEILILILDRTKNSKIKLEFIEDLDLSNYIVKAKEVGYMFKLSGVVSEEGENGHYIAYCRNLKNQIWYKYDNNKVSQVYNFKVQIVDSGIVTILFYQKGN